MAAPFFDNDLFDFAPDGADTGEDRSADGAEPDDKDHESFSVASGAAGTGDGQESSGRVSNKARKRGSRGGSGGRPAEEKRWRSGAVPTAPSFDGDVESNPYCLRHYRRRLLRWVTLTKEYLPPNEQALRALEQLHGQAELEFEEVDDARFNHPDGIQRLLADLEQAFGEREIFRQGGVIREFESIGRMQGESITAFIRRFRLLERKLMDNKVPAYPEQARVIKLLDGLRLDEKATASVLLAAGNKYDMQAVLEALRIQYPPGMSITGLPKGLASLSTRSARSSAPSRASSYRSSSTATSSRKSSRMGQARKWTHWHTGWDEEMPEELVEEDAGIDYQDEIYAEEEPDALTENADEEEDELIPVDEGEELEIYEEPGSLDSAALLASAVEALTVTSKKLASLAQRGGKAAKGMTHGADRQTRLRGSLCLGCGASDHWIRECPHVSNFQAQIASADLELDPEGVPVHASWTASANMCEDQLQRAPLFEIPRPPSIFLSTCSDASFLIADTGCQRQVAGHMWHQQRQSEMLPLKPLHFPEVCKFSFGPTEGMPSQGRFLYPAGIAGEMVALGISSVDASAPGLLSRSTMEALGAVPDILEGRIHFKALGGKTTRLYLSPCRHLALKIDEWPENEFEWPGRYLHEKYGQHGPPDVCHENAFPPERVRLTAIANSDTARQPHASQTASRGSASGMADSEFVYVTHQSVLYYSAATLRPNLKDRVLSIYMEPCSAVTMMTTQAAMAAMSALQLNRYLKTPEECTHTTGPGTRTYSAAGIRIRICDSCGMRWALTSRGEALPAVPKANPNAKTPMGLNDAQKLRLVEDKTDKAKAKPKAKTNPAPGANGGNSDGSSQPLSGYSPAPWPTTTPPPPPRFHGSPQLRAPTPTQRPTMFSLHRGRQGTQQRQWRGGPRSTASSDTESMSVTSDNWWNMRSDQRRTSRRRPNLENPNAEDQNEEELDMSRTRDMQEAEEHLEDLENDVNYWEERMARDDWDPEDHDAVVYPLSCSDHPLGPEDRGCFSLKQGQKKRFLGAAKAIHAAWAAESQVYKNRTESARHCRKFKADIVEIYAGKAAISEAALSVGLRVLQPVDTVYGQTLENDEDFEALEKLLLARMPYLVVWEPRCTLWSNLQHFNYTAEELEVLRRKERKHVAGMSRVIENLYTRGIHFLIENPRHTPFWETPELRRLRALQDVQFGEGHMCAFGLRNDRGDLLKKPTGWMGSLPEVLQALCVECSGQHQHGQCVGGNAARKAQVYTDMLAKACVDGLVRALRRVGDERWNQSWWSGTSLPEVSSPWVNDVSYDNSVDNFEHLWEPPGELECQAYFLDVSRHHDSWGPLLKEAEQRLRGMTTSSVTLKPSPFFEQVKTLVPWKIHKVQLFRTPKQRRLPQDVLLEGIQHRGAALLYNDDQIGIEAETVHSIMDAPAGKYDKPVRVAIYFYGDAPATSLKPEDNARPEAAKAPARHQPEVDDERMLPHQPGYRDISFPGVDIPAWVQQVLRRVHVNLGHPPREVLVRQLATAGASDVALKGARALRCETCLRVSPPHQPRVSKAFQAKRFNDRMCIDVIYIKDVRGGTHMFLNIVDDATCYQVAPRLHSRSEDAVISTLVGGWFQYFGPPDEMAIDAEGAFRGMRFENLHAQLNVAVRCVPPDSHWQLGKAERHGQALKYNASRLIHQFAALTVPEVNLCIIMACYAKNRLIRRSGSSPAQWVFGRDQKLPASLLSDGGSIESAELLNDSQRLLQIEAVRTEAMKNHHAFEAHEALRAALLRKSRPYRGTFSPGQKIAYFRARTATGDGEGSAEGYRQGLVLALDRNPHSNTAVNIWVRNSRGRLVQCSPEQCRPIYGEQEWWAPDAADPEVLKHCDRDLQIHPRAFRAPEARPGLAADRSVAQELEQDARAALPGADAPALPEADAHRDQPAPLVLDQAGNPVAESPMFSPLMIAERAQDRYLVDNPDNPNRILNLQNQCFLGLQSYHGRQRSRWSEAYPDQTGHVYPDRILLQNRCFLGLLAIAVGLLWHPAVHFLDKYLSKQDISLLSPNQKQKASSDCGEQYRIFPRECHRCGGTCSVTKPQDVVSWLDEVKEREAFDRLVGVPKERVKTQPLEYGPELRDEIEYYQSPDSTTAYPSSSTTISSPPGMHRLDILRRHARGQQLRHGWDGSPLEVPPIYQYDSFLTTCHHVCPEAMVEMPEITPQVLQVSEDVNAKPARLSEQLADVLLRRKDFSHDMCLQLLQVVEMKRPDRQCLAPGKRDIGSLTLGYYSHGKTGGITNATQRHSRLTKYLNNYLRHWGMKGPFSSLFVARNVHSKAHKDVNNSKGSVNGQVALGEHVGGELWVERDPDDCDFDNMEPRSINGEKKWGYVKDTYQNLTLFNPARFHASADFMGDRYTITAYQTRMVEQAPSDHLDFLRKLQFRPSEKRVAFVASASEGVELKADTSEKKAPMTVQEAYPLKAQTSASTETEKVIAMESSSESDGNDGTYETRRAAQQARKKEVHWQSMTEDEFAPFVEALKREWSEWEKWSSCTPVWVQKGTVSPHLILKSRVCYRWKPVPEGQKAKARIVIAGFRDPHLPLLTRDAPVLARTSFHLLLQWAACHRVTLWNADCKSAFLQGEPDTERPESIFMKPPQDPVALEAVPQWKDVRLLYRLSAPVYGQSNAPRRWFEHVRKVLTNLGWIQHSLDPCLFMQVSGDEVVSLLGIHVDDLLGGALAGHEELLNRVEASFTWGSPWVSKDFTFVGRHVRQWPDGSITLDQASYINEVPATKVKLEESVPLHDNPELITEFRSGIGSLQWLAGTTRGDVSADTSLLQKSPKELTVADLKEVNSVLRYIRATSEASIKIVPLDLEKLIFVTYGDSGFANAPNNKSQGGLVVTATDKEALGQTRAASLLDWKSYRHQRILRSTLAAEAAALDRSYDHARFMAMAFSEMVYANFKATMNERPLFEVIPVTDARSLWDAVHRLSTSFTEKRVEIDVAALRQSCRGLRWVPTEQMKADCMTKRSRLLRDAFRRWMAEPSVTLVDSKAPGDIMTGADANVAYRTRDLGSLKKDNRLMLMMLALLAFGGPGQLAKAARDLGSLKKDNRLMLMMLALAARDLGSLKQDNRLMLMMLALAGPGSSKAAWDLGSLKKDNRLMLMMLALAGPGSSRKPRGTWPEKDNRLMLMMLALAGPGSSRKQRGTWEA
ncbi:TY5A [Symbiodinium natans]|uniref:TY5A protein n=1 Tax=Symbiodinium natans TaxID=878477 RepID=A0A812LSM4_9DINO|nr:TY5A [Symbiodinium natans]